jgi:hypothetical protein
MIDTVFIIAPAGRTRKASLHEIRCEEDRAMPELRFEYTGSVKFYDPRRGFGFVFSEDGARIQRDGCRAKYLKSTSDYPHYLLSAVERAFGKPRDWDNRKALVDFTIDDFDQALARDPMVVAARLEEERDRANGFAGYEADV